MMNRITWKQPGLLSRILLFVCAPLLAFLGLLGFFLFARLEGWAERRMQDDVQLVARALQAPMGHALERKRQGSVEYSLESVLDIGRVYGARVFDESGALVASGFGEEDESRSVDVADPRFDDWTRQTGAYGEMEGRSVYSYFVPLENSAGERVGLLQVSRLHREMIDQLRGFRQTAGWVFLFSSAGMIGIVLTGYRGAVGAGLGRLQKSMMRVEAGERDHRAWAGGPVEIARLAGTFNQMLDSMDRAEKEIRDRRKSEESLQARLRKTENLAAIGKVAAGVAHELGGPMSVIDGQAQRLLRHGNGGNERAAVEAIRGEIARMGGIVRGLLEFGRTHDNPRQTVRVDHLMDSVLLAVDQEEPGRAVRVEREGVAPGPLVQVNRVRLELALTNLVRNARQAATGRVRVVWEERGERAAVVVEDDGPGLPPAVRTRIFEPFFTTRASSGGTGLGLAIVQQVADECGGGVEAFTGTLGGAAFRLSIPLAGES